MYELFKIDRFADFFGISRSTVFSWMKSGILIERKHYLRDNRTLRFIMEPEVIKDLHQQAVKKPIKNIDKRSRKINKIVTSQ
jgi:hypothetical protein